MQEVAKIIEEMHHLSVQVKLSKGGWKLLEDVVNTRGLFLATRGRPFRGCLLLLARLIDCTKQRGGDPELFHGDKVSKICDGVSVSLVVVIVVVVVERRKALQAECAQSASVFFERIDDGCGFESIMTGSNT